MKLNWNFQRGWGSSRKSLPWGRYGYFLEFTIIASYLFDAPLAPQAFNWSFPYIGTSETKPLIDNQMYMCNKKPLGCISLTFKKIQDWILKSERFQKWIFRFFSKQVNPRSLWSWCIKGTKESTSRLDSSVSSVHHDPKDLGLICLVKKCKIHFQTLWI